MAQRANSDRIGFYEHVTEAASILAAGILRGRKLKMNRISNELSLSDSGPDVFVGENVHSDKSLAKGENR